MLFFFRKKNILEVTWEMLKVSMTSKKQLRMIQNGLHFFKIYVYIYIYYMFGSLHMSV